MRSSPGHKKDGESIYPLFKQINFNPILDKSKGTITKEEFNERHKNTTEQIVPVITCTVYQPQYGWATKLINIYLKTYCYIGDGGRDGIKNVLHPPIDNILWKGIDNTFPIPNKDEDIRKIRWHTDCLRFMHSSDNRIKNITSYEIYRTIIKFI